MASYNCQVKRDEHARLAAVPAAVAEDGLAAVGARARLTFVCVPRWAPRTPIRKVRKVKKTRTGPRGRPARRRGP